MNVKASTKKATVLTAMLASTRTGARMKPPISRKTECIGLDARASAPGSNPQDTRVLSPHPYPAASSNSWLR